MTVEEFKTELIHRIRSTDVNQFLHLYIKAKTWSDILKALKASKYYEWSFRNGVIDFDLLKVIPKTEREKERFYDRKLTINNTTLSIILLDKADLTIAQNGSNRCKITMLGNSQLDANLSGNSMIELEQYHESQSNIITNDQSFLHGLFTNESVSNIQSFGNSTIKTTQNKYSTCTVTINDNSYLNANSMWYSELNIFDAAQRHKITQTQKAIVNINAN